MATPVAPFTVIPLSDIDPDSPLTSQLFDSLRLNDQNLFAQLVGDPVSSPTFTPAAEHDHDGVNSKTVNGADFILVEKKLITADVTSVTFTGLDGNTDEVYRLIARIHGTSSVNQIDLRPNGISTNQDSSVFADNAALVTRTALVLTEDFFTDVILQTFEATFWAKANPNSIATNRLLQSWGVNAAATGAPNMVHGVGLWDEDATNVTSLEIRSALANNIKNGSTIALYKLRQ